MAPKRKAEGESKKAEDSKKSKKTDAGPQLKKEPNTDVASSVRTQNGEYLNKLQVALNAIRNLWPDIASLDALPTSGDTGHDGMVGFLAPFNPAADDAKFKDIADGEEPGEYMCGINFFGRT